MGESVKERREIQHLNYRPIDRQMEDAQVRVHKSRAIAAHRDTVASYSQTLAPTEQKQGQNRVTTPFLDTGDNDFGKLLDWSNEGPKLCAIMAQIARLASEASSLAYLSSSRQCVETMKSEIELIPANQEAIKQEYDAKIAQTNKQGDQAQTEAWSTGMLTLTGMGFGAQEWWEKELGKEEEMLTANDSQMGIANETEAGSVKAALNDGGQPVAGALTQEEEDLVATANQRIKDKDWNNITEAESAAWIKKQPGLSTKEVREYKQHFKYMKAGRAGKVLNQCNKAIGKCAEKMQTFNLIAQVAKAGNEARYLPPIAEEQGHERDGAAKKNMNDQMGQLYAQYYNQQNEQMQQSKQMSDSFVEAFRSSVLQGLMPALTHLWS